MILSEFIIHRLLESFEGKFSVVNSYNGRGFGYLKTNIKGFNEACVSTPFLVLTDLDKAKCPVQLVNDWLGDQRHPSLIFRVAVREVEAWLLGDAISFSTYTRTPINQIPKDPEQEEDPKLTLINLVSRYGPRALKEDIVPIGTASIGRAYNLRLMEYIISHWNIQRAMNTCESLRRMYTNLERYNN